MEQAAQAREPLEANSIVQFRPDGVTLHPQAFGTAGMTADQRATLERILTEIHQKYLEVEADRSEFKYESGMHVTTIRLFNEDLTNLLEN